MLACVAGSLVWTYSPPLETPPSRRVAHRRSVLHMDMNADDIFFHTPPERSKARQHGFERAVSNAPRTVGAAQLRTELHGVPTAKDAAVDAQSEAFERGLLMGFSMAQHLPAMPMPPEEMLSPEQPAKQGLSPCTIKLIGVGGGGGNTLNRVAGLDLGAAPHHVQMRGPRLQSAVAVPPRRRTRAHPGACPGFAHSARAATASASARLARAFRPPSDRAARSAVLLSLLSV